MRVTSPLPYTSLLGRPVTGAATPTLRGKNGNIVSLPLSLNPPDHTSSRQHTGNNIGKHSGNIFGNSGKNGNAARLLIHPHPETTTARTPEKFSIRLIHPTSATPPATIPATFSAKTATIPATILAMTYATSHPPAATTPPTRFKLKTPAKRQQIFRPLFRPLLRPLSPIPRHRQRVQCAHGPSTRLTATEDSQ